jgi:hypothetical protein
MKTPMKHATVAFALLLVAGEAAGQAPIDVATAKLYFEEARQLGATDAGKLWGRSVAGPMLFVDAATGTIVANRADSDGLFKSSDGVWTAKLPPGVAPANTGIDVGGIRWAMIMWPVSDNIYTRRRLLMHESFHRIQDSLGFPGSNPSNAHLARADGRIWLRLEFRALTEALLRDGDERRRALRDALTFRARRQSMFPNAAEEERQLELNEGLAEYTGLALSGLPRAVLGDRVAIQLAQQEQQESQSRGFAYASGPAYALLLDAAGSAWRRGISRAGDLAAMARNVYRISDVRVSDADSLIARYSGARMIAAEKEREASRIAEETRLRARFLEGPTLKLPVGSRFSFSFDPNGAVPLPGVGIVYKSSRISDEWGSLTVTSGGVLLLRNAEGMFTGVVIANPLSKDGIVSGDGWTLELSDGWKAKDGEARGAMIVGKESQ